MDREKIALKNFAFAGIKREIPSGQDRPILPARVANHNTGFASSCPLAEQAVKDTRMNLLKEPGTTSNRKFV